MGIVWTSHRTKINILRLLFFIFRNTKQKINLIDKINKICENNVSLHGYSNLEYAEEFIENTYPIDTTQYPYAISRYTY